MKTLMPLTADRWAIAAYALFYSDLAAAEKRWLHEGEAIKERYRLAGQNLAVFVSKECDAAVSEFANRQRTSP